MIQKLIEVSYCDLYSLHLVLSHCLSILKSVVMLIVALFINLIVISYRLY